MPDVSVVIPNLNYGQYLHQAIDSAFWQAAETIVVDGGSTDESRQVVQSYALEHAGSGRFLSWLEEPIRGMGRARNTGIRSAQGYFILPLDADDWIEPTFVERCLEQMLDPKVGIVATALKNEPGKVQYPDEPITAERLLDRNRLFTCSMFRRECWEEVGGYDPRPNVTYEDWEFWLRIVAAGWEVAVIREPLFHYRIHPGSSCTKMTTERDLRFRNYIRMKHAELYAAYGLLGRARDASPELEIPSGPKKGGGP